MRLFHEFRVIVNRAVSRGILDERAENGVVELELRDIVDLNFDSERFRTRAQDLDRFRMAIVSEEKCFPIRNGGVTERHCFGGARRFIEHRRIRDLKFRQIGNRRLKIEQCFESALCDFRLVWCVSRVPTGILENVALNDRRRDAVGVTGTNKRLRDFVLLRDRA